MPRELQLGHLTLLLPRLRQIKGLTRQQLATQVGCSEKHYQAIELGTATPSLDVLSGVAATLGVPAWVLICDDAEVIKKVTGILDLSETTRRKRGRPTLELSIIAISGDDEQVELGTVRRRVSDNLYVSTSSLKLRRGSEFRHMAMAQTAAKGLRDIEAIKFVREESETTGVQYVYKIRFGTTY